MFGNLGEMAKLMGRAKEIQANMAKFKEELPKMEFVACSPDGKVHAKVSGDFQIREITIEDDVLQNKALLEKQIAFAVNNAILEAKKMAQEKMTEMTGGIDIPGLF